MGWGYTLYGVWGRGTHCMVCGGGGVRVWGGGTHCMVCEGVGWGTHCMVCEGVGGGVRVWSKGYTLYGV